MTNAAKGCAEHAKYVKLGSISGEIVFICRRKLCDDHFLSRLVTTKWGMAEKNTDINETLDNDADGGKGRVKFQVCFPCGLHPLRNGPNHLNLASYSIPSTTVHF